MPIDHKNIRVLALAMINHQGKFLACAGFDELKNRRHYRLLGGGVEFGETSVQALRRELKEELGLSINIVKLLGVEENRFIFNGRPGHEIIFLYQVKLRSQRAYRQNDFPILDSKGAYRAEWIDSNNLRGARFYPLLAVKYL